jgi:phosphate-selective porin
MKKILLILGIASTLTIAISACNSTKNVSGSSDSVVVDTTMPKPIDTMKRDTMKKMPPDTTKMPPAQ